MAHGTVSSQEIGARGERLYAELLRARVETPENQGKRISIDINSGDYEIDENAVEAALRLRQRRPDAMLYGKSVGRDYVYAFGASLDETKQ